jgi:hypothetical protein
MRGHVGIDLCKGGLVSQFDHEHRRSLPETGTAVKRRGDKGLSQKS